MLAFKLTYRIVFFVLTVSLILNACNTQKGISTKGFKNDIFGIQDLKCTETLSPDAIDSRVADLSCNDISLSYDYGKYSYAGPLTPEEEFTRTFDTYHHIKFFEDRMIDPKVYKIFLDSVKVIDVRKRMESDKLMFKCDPCNTTAELAFKGDTYYYPLTMAEDQLDMKGLTCQFEEKGDYIYKLYKLDNEFPGLYIAPIKNRYKNKNTLSIQVTEANLPTDEIMAILKSVYMIEE